MTIKALYPTVRPTLNLDFADTRLLDPRITFSRASTGTFVGSNRLIQAAASGVPRFDHNPTTGESLGLLMEEARTNLVLRSEEFDNASWTKLRSTISANAIAAPDGATTAEKLVEDSTASATHQTSQTITKAASAIAYTASIYVKAAERSQVFVGLSDFGGNESYAIFNLSAKTASSPVNGGTFTGGVATITELSNGWFRCTISATSSTSTAIAALVRIADSSGNVVYTGDGTSGIYVWGAQLEVGAFPTSYIPTTSSTATRAADVASMTGTNFSSWYNALQGAIYVEFSATTTGVNDTGGNAFPFVYLIDSAGAINSAHFCVLSKGYGPGVLCGVDVSGSTQAAAYIATSLGDLTVKKIAMGYQENNFGFVLNAGVVQTDMSGTVPLTPDRLFIGSQFTGNVFTGTIKRFIYFPVRPSNASLQAITTP
jgi:hypothetical protein